MFDICTNLVFTPFPNLQNRGHRRGTSWDFLSSGPEAFVPPKSLHQRHRRVVSWDARAKAASANHTLHETFDFGMIAGAALSDFNPSSPLRDEEALLAEPVDSIQRHPFAGSGFDDHPLRRISPPTPTMSSLQDLQSPTMLSLTEASMEPLPAKMEDYPFQKNKSDQDEFAFFKGLFSPTELEVETELLDTFDVGRQDALPNMKTDFTAPSSDFLPCDSASVVDELMDLAGTVTVGFDAPPAMVPLPTVPEPEPLSLPMPQTSYHTHSHPAPISSMVSPLASGAVNEHNFPRKLYRLLEDCESNPDYRNIVSWSDDGTSFSVNCKKQFVDYILPNYFDQTQYASFRRQLNMYNFVRQGNTSTYSNPHFIKNRRDLLDLIQRKSVNQSKGN
jgi:HSF-type DNA-binding